MEQIKKFILLFSMAALILPVSLSAQINAGGDLYKIKTADEEVKKDDSMPSGWFPKEILFNSFKADPRKIGFTFSYRWGDDVFGDDDAFETRPDYRNKLGVGAVAFGDRFPIYRWNNVLGGSIQVGVEGQVWAVFAQEKKSTPLMNADYLLGFPLIYVYNDLSFRFRLYHVSTHIGDEYIMAHKDDTDFARENPSRETVDLFSSYNLLDQIRLYGGAGYHFHRDNEFAIERWFIGYGAEYRPFGKLNSGSLFWNPYVAVNIYNREDNNWRFEVSTVVGVDFDTLDTTNNKSFRVYMEYYYGNCFDGQFSRLENSYFSLAVGYGI